MKSWPLLCPDACPSVRTHDTIGSQKQHKDNFYLQKICKTREPAEPAEPAVIQPWQKHKSLTEVREKRNAKLYTMAEKEVVHGTYPGWREVTGHISSAVTKTAQNPSNWAIKHLMTCITAKCTVVPSLHHMMV